MREGGGERALALDIGGTKIAAAVVAANGDILGRTRLRVPRGGDAESIFAVLLEGASAAMAGAGVVPADLAGIGCGCGGPMRWPVGEVSPLNIPAWRGFPLRERLRAAFPGMRVLVHNDAVALAAGEHWRGREASKGASGGASSANMLAVTVSTGVGGGLVLAGRLFHGASGNGGHFGHIIVDPEGPPCACGARGCVEAIASGPRSVEWAVRSGWNTSDGTQPPGAEPGAKSRVNYETNFETNFETDPGGEPDGKSLAASAEAGNPVAKRALARAGEAVGIALASCGSLLDLDVAVVGGGFSRSGPDFWDALDAAFSRFARLDFARSIEIRRTTPDDGGLRGAAAFILAPDAYGWDDAPSESDGSGSMPPTPAPVR
jgi:glucokinase